MPTPIKTLLAVLSKNWFIAAILASFALGLYLPRGEGLLNPGGATKPLLIFILLFLSGISIPTERIIGDLKDFRLHLFIQGVIFLLYPLMTWLLLLLFGRFIDPSIRIGILALSCLPSTISSCIFFSQVSGGNTTAAVFNAAASNIAAVLITPLLFALLIPGGNSTSAGIAPTEVFTSLVRIILVPILIGQSARYPLRKSMDQFKGLLGNLSNLIIFLLVYFAVSRSSTAILESASFQLFAGPLVFLSLLNILVLLLIHILGRAAGLDRRNRITALFVGSHKTLALGLPLTAAVFGGDPEYYAFVILPLIFYYHIQLISSGVLRVHVFQSASL
jgi:sodium/bile acid cotransporter 7